VNRPNPFVFVGLGNPGKEYEKTRHNLGYLVVQAFARKMGWRFKEEKRFDANVTKGVIGEVTVHLLLPTTYMNLSGIAVSRYLDFLKLGVDCLVIVIDDLSLPFGQLKLKMMGSSGGHNGLKSIETHLGTAHYKRLKMGIGHPGKQRILADYVLDFFNQEEKEQLEKFIDCGVNVLQQLVSEPIAYVMKTVNTSSKKKKKEDEKSQQSPILGLGENTDEPT
jgi:PTH1 family peptidyl-tRNA hydrolase